MKEQSLGAAGACLRRRLKGHRTWLVPFQMQQKGMASPRSKTKWIAGPVGAGGGLAVTAAPPSISEVFWKFHVSFRGGPSA